MNLWDLWKAIRGGATAISRSGPSGPLRFLVGKGLVKGPVLDLGAGRGADASYLRSRGIKTAKHDPQHFNNPAALKKRYQTVLCTYVLNVVTPEVQNQILTQIKRSLAPGGTAYVSVRRDLDTGGQAGRGTTQRYVKLAAPKLVDNGTFAIYKISRS